MQRRTTGKITGSKANKKMEKFAMAGKAKAEQGEIILIFLN